MRKWLSKTVPSRVLTKDVWLGYKALRNEGVITCVFQVMQMPAVTPGRGSYIPPSSVQGMVPTSMPGGGANMEQNNQSHQAGQAYSMNIKLQN